MPQSPTNTGENDTLELERQVGALLQSIDTTTETIERRLAVDDDAPPQRKADAPAPGSEAATDAATQDAGETSEATEPDTAAPADEAEVEPEAEASDAGDTKDGGEETVEAEAVAEAADTAATEAAGEKTGAADDDIDAGVEQLIAEATEAATSDITADDDESDDAADESGEGWVAQDEVAEAATEQAAAPAPANIADVDEQLAREAAGAVDEDEIEGEFLTPDEVEDRLPEAPAEVAAADAAASASDAKPKAPPKESAAPADASAAAVAAAAKADPGPSPGDAKQDASRRNLLAQPVSLAQTALVIINKPFARLPRAMRDTIGWIAINTIFIAICVWVYLMLR
ncbi:MAG: hypothetical protein EA376_03610 [Phycisphaeraceae bacterium]|nr:MAG: hypothetical protein EA376_03610 [Phycisphaeraceae bacterium]